MGRSAEPPAQSCSEPNNGDCGVLVDSSLSFAGCGDCFLIYVNEVSVLAAIKQRWLAAGCEKSPKECPAILCTAPPLPATCFVSTAGGPGMCHTPGKLPGVG